MLLATLGFARADTFEERVRNYILNNPEVILEALEILSERDAQLATARKVAVFPELFTDATSLGEGNAEAQLQVIKFFDYRCAPCRAVHPALVDFVATHPQVRIEMRHLPILSPGSERAARFALATQATYGDKMYRAVHDRLWELQGSLNSVGFRRISDELKLDFAKIEKAMEREDITQRIDYNRNAAIALEILGTPAFVTKNNVVFGSTDIDVLSEMWLSQ